MNTKEKAHAYDEALKRAKKELAVSSPDSDSTRQIFRFFPQLRESEDEKIRKALIDGVSQIRCKGDITREQMIAYLEKQKAMTAEEHEIVKVNINGIHGLFPPVGDGHYIDEHVALDKTAGEKQKEPHYTKRNALFDKCVENCDPKTVEEVNKRVGDIMNIPELSPFEQALTNFIGDWENDEEHWPSQFAKKHGKRIFDIAREEVQKEQKHPNGCFTCDEYKKGYEEGRRNGVTAGYNKAMKEVEQKEQKPWKVGANAYFTPEQKSVVTHGKTYHVDTLGTQQVIAGKMPQKPVEWDDYTKTNLDRALQIIKKAKGNLQGYQTDDGIYECDKAIECLEHFLYRGLEIEKPAEWSEEDEEMIKSILFVLESYVSHSESASSPSLITSYPTYYKEIDWLKSLRPSWKPSEEQMDALNALNCHGDLSYVGQQNQLISLYNDLKKLI